MVHMKSDGGIIACKSMKLNMSNMFFGCLRPSVAALQFIIGYLRNGA